MLCLLAHKIITIETAKTSK